uniref:NADH-ubiquinone oxidoreductase chain 5 n=1 Tax=Dermestidae sp. GENSP01 TaxID=1205804 RepID=A0A0S2MRV9_9COLE|nr:NADH deshydrogenase subunit 5 [Dermestidae sp. GENSP01]
MLSICLIYSIFFFTCSFISFIFGLLFLSWSYTLVLEFVFFSVQSCSIEMVVLFDWMSLLFMSVVFFISSMVVYYSVDYMHGDLNLVRFVLIVSMFVFSMVLLIISPNLISILLGWDGLGLVSYCLVIYYQNFKSFNAGMLTALTNRVGDVALLISIAWMVNYGGWSFFYWLDVVKGDYSMIFISWLVVVAGMTKSAQIPFSSWLPAAMAAPTPVSSLVHSSTLVTAGVYLLIRFNFCFGDFIFYFLLFFSSLTMFMAGLGANYEFDLKKIIAMSTLSQLGLMLGILSLGGYDLAFFHLLTHALFKALLFMCSGNIIHVVLDCQDIRYLGGLVVKMPLTCCFFNICNLALCGFPFFSGFYSKDLLLEIVSMDYFNLYIYLLFFISTGLTVSYTFRLVYYSVAGDYNFISCSSINDNSFNMLKGMFGLIFFVIISGSLFMWIFFPTPCFICLPFLFKVMALLVSFLGFWLGYELSKFSLCYELFSLKFTKEFFFLGSMWNMPFISTYSFSLYPLILGSGFYKTVDQGWSEYFGSYKLFGVLKFSSSFLLFVHYNNFKLFLLLLVILVILFFLFLF